MPNPMEDKARRSFGDKLGAMTGDRGEYPNDKAARIASAKPNPNAQGDAAAMPEETFIGAPARQVSNYGKVRK